jgi:hypothetical protein
MILSIVGCGGGKDDPTSVALRPSKEKPQGGNGAVAQNGSTTPNNGASEAPAEEGFGGITGRIVIAEADLGSVPPPGVKLYDIGKATVEPNLCAKDMPILDESLLVNPMTGGLKNAFFYLVKKPLGGKSEIESQKSWPTADPSGAKMVLDQKNCTYHPHAMVVLIGDELTAQSQDATLHSYKGVCKRNSNFNLSVPSNGAIQVDVFKKPETEPAFISCATHSWMSAYQLPLDHPYAAVTDADGKFTISDLPSGEHTFTIWHEKGKKIRDYPVVVKANETVDLGNITLRLSQLNK